MSHYLPTKIGSYLLRLHAEYAARERALEMEIVTSCRARVIEETDFDNYDGGTHGHDARLYLPLHVLAKVGIKQQDKVAEAICSDLNDLARQVPNEYFRAVQLELNDENDPEYQAAIPFSQKQPANPDTLPFWKPGMVRLFISHRDTHKVDANELASALEPYGISSFVAHDTIQPMSEWRKEIMRGLETMEVMLLFLTDDFQDSIWTMQEVGYALGADRPIISLKLGKKDPPGFVSHEQAQRGNKDKPVEAASALYPLIAKALGQRERLQAALVASFVAAPDWGDARSRFDRLNGGVEKLSEKELTAIIDGFYRNDQLHNATYLTHGGHRRLRGFLERTTGKEFEIQGRRIKEVVAQSENLDDIPF